MTRNVDVTISLPQDLADWLRDDFRLSDPDYNFSWQHRIAQLVRDALPKPAYVPAVGDVVTVRLKTGTYEYMGERVLFATDDVVCAVCPGGDYSAYKVSNWTFTLETPAAASQASASVSEGSVSAPQSAVEAPQ